MSPGFTSQMARNMFYGGTVFFALLFAADLRHRTTHSRALNARAHARRGGGKKIWETRNCIGCHTLLGEGAYFAPELGNVYKRRGGDFIKAWMKAMPTGGRAAARCRSST